MQPLLQPWNEPATLQPAALGPPAAAGDPIRWPVMVQRWVDVVFLHWRYDPAVVQALLPPGVTVDVYDGSAWVGLVPFRMEGLGLPRLAPLPLVGSFPEVNVRTYVHAGDRRGVWFFSLDIDRVLPTVVARAVYDLPYCYGRAGHRRLGSVVSTEVERRWPAADGGAGAEIVVRGGRALTGPDPLAHFLTSRWGLLSAGRRGRIRWAPIHHGPWPLHHAEVLHLDERLVAATGLPAPDGPPHALWSPGVDVTVGLPTRRLLVPDRCGQPPVEKIESAV
ncbi:MAG: DUF2071 domain-containing protein [Acidimicrobiia bacterium]|nr:DUF2071 domain-containing protein [Acidimicrobiia bacterium]MDH5289326.1 DUF2071 domain-containing protein [Acidimicrobiia bacterium]